MVGLRLELQEKREARGSQCGLNSAPMSPAHLLEAPAIRHGGDHLCELLLLALQHSVHMLGWHLRAEGSHGGHLWEHWAPKRGMSTCCTLPNDIPLEGGWQSKRREGAMP